MADEYEFDNPSDLDEMQMPDVPEMPEDEPQQPMMQQAPPQMPARPRPKLQPRRPRPAAPMTPQQAAAQAAPMPQAPMLPQQQAIQQAQQVAAPARFIPYEIPKKIGVLDRNAGRPIIEDEDMLRVIMAQLADLKNDIEELKAQLYAG